MSVSSLVASSYQPVGLGVPLRNVVGPAAEVELQRDDLWRMDGATCWRMIICVRGRVWITQERDLRDYELEAGEFLVVTQPGVVLVQALQDARFQVTPSLKSVPYIGDFLTFR